MVHLTAVVALYGTSGTTGTLQLPITCREALSVMVKVMVDGAWAPVIPPRFLIRAETAQVEPQPEVSTDTTV